MNSFENEVLKRLTSIEQKIDYLTARHRYVEDLVDEMMPIGRLVSNYAGDQLGALEEKGYFAVGTEVLKLIDEVVVNYGAEELASLGSNLVAVLDTIQNMTQPDVLAIANEATDVLQHTDEVEPVGVFGMMGATRDEDVQRGMAIALEILRHLGKSRGTNLPPRKRREPRPTPPPAPSDSAPSKSAPTAKLKMKVAPQAAGAAPVIWEGVPFSPEGFLINPADWSRSLAEKMAASIKITLTDRHWQVLEWIRAEHARSGASPNVRAMGAGSGVSTKELYQLFPKTPGKTAARLAGVPKPVGCV